MADLGIGIHGSVYKNLGIKFSPEEAIQWALSGKTSRRNRSGGLGLQLLQDFIKLNCGKLVIISDTGYWEYGDGNQYLKKLSLPFPGTVVNIEVNTADINSYCLSNEIDASDIF